MPQSMLDLLDEERETWRRFYCAVELILRDA
jgi:hypothetical protein